MGGLRSVLRDFLTAPLPALPNKPALLAAQVDVLRLQLGELQERRPKSNALEVSYRALRDAMTAPGGFNSLEGRHLRRAPWLIFEAREAGSIPLLEDSRFFGGYLAALQRSASSSAIVSLVFCFLYFYPTQVPYFSLLRKILRERLLPLCTTARGERWRECVNSCGLLDDDAPRVFANTLTKSSADPKGLLDSCCVKGLLSDSAFVHSVFRESLRSASDGLRARSLEENGLRFFLAFASGTRGDRAGGLRFPTLRTDLANGLLLPFADRAAEALHQPTIRAFLLEALGDPRLARGGGWSGVDERAREVMLGWLVQTTLEDFFRLLQHAAQADATALHHWRYRQAFWAAYLRAGHIRDAWVVLGPAVKHFAAKVLVDDASRAYGQISGLGVQNHHSVIIMRIGNLTVTEWSHSGKYRIWIDSNSGRPRLYRSRYKRADVTANTDDEGSHNGSENGRWQGRLADLIRSHTGISMTYRSYMPARG